MLHKEVVAGNLIVEHPFGNLQLGRFLAHGVKQSPHLGLSHRKHIILEEERTYGHQSDEYNERTHHLHQRNARRLHGRKLEPFAEVAERHKGCKQDGQRERHGHHSEGGVEEQLAYHVHLQPLAHKLVDIAPEELHQHDEQTDKKRHQEQRQETAQHESV